MEKNNLTTILVAGLVIVAIILAINSKVSDEELRELTVSGTSTLTVEPNKAEVYIKILTLEKTAQESKNQNSQISKKVMEALKKLGIKDKDIETSQFSIYPKYEYEDIIENEFRKSKQTLIGYEVINVLKVTTQDLDKVGKLVDAAVDAGANDIERVSFGLTKDKEREVKQQAMILASNDAKEKAVALATNIGVTLGKPFSISELSFNYQPFDFYAKGMFEAAAPAPETVINHQKIDVSASVELIYEIK